MFLSHQFHHGKSLRIGKNKKRAFSPFFPRAPATGLIPRAGTPRQYPMLLYLRRTRGPTGNIRNSDSIKQSGFARSKKVNPAIIIPPVKPSPLIYCVRSSEWSVREKKRHEEVPIRGRPFFRTIELWFIGSCLSRLFFFFSRTEYLSARITINYNKLISVRYPATCLNVNNNDRKIHWHQEL